jgi:parvulin-like peptidyl-prolyl isomerase
MLEPFGIGSLPKKQEAFTGLAVLHSSVDFMMPKSFRTSIPVALLLAAVATATPPERLPVERVVAVIERQVYTTTELDMWALDVRLRQGDDPTTPLSSYHQAVITRMVDTKLLAGWAELQLESPTPDIIDAEFAQAMVEYERLAGGTERLADQLRDAKLDDQEFRIWVREKERQEFITSQVLMAYANLGGASPLDGELKEATRLRISHILIADRSEEGKRAALTIRRDIGAGLPFPKAARLYSADPVTAERGGDLGWFAPEELDSTLWATAVGTPRDTVSEPVLAKGGWHLLLVVDLETPKSRGWAVAMRGAEDRQLERLRRESDVRLAEGFTLRKIEVPKGQEVPEL